LLLSSRWLPPQRPRSCGLSRRRTTRPDTPPRCAVCVPDAVGANVLTPVALLDGNTSRGGSNSWAQRGVPQRRAPRTRALARPRSDNALIFPCSRPFKTSVSLYWRPCGVAIRHNGDRASWPMDEAMDEAIPKAVGFGARLSRAVPRNRVVGSFAMARWLFLLPACTS
jgi:hypothetical protein